MLPRKSMVHVRVANDLKAQAIEALSGERLGVSGGVRNPLNRVAADGVLPAGPAADPDAYAAWFRAKVAGGAGRPAPYHTA